jgi:hypothetical protein
MQASVIGDQNNFLPKVLRCQGPLVNVVKSVGVLEEIVLANKKHWPPSTIECASRVLSEVLQQPLVGRDNFLLFCFHIFHSDRRQADSGISLTASRALGLLLALRAGLRFASAAFAPV